MSRSRAFISGTVSRRLARTLPWQAMDESSASNCCSMRSLLPWASRSLSTSRTSVSLSALRSSAGTSRTTRVSGPARSTMKPRRWNTWGCCSAKSASREDTAMDTGTSSGWLRTFSSAQSRFRRS